MNVIHDAEKMEFRIDLGLYRAVLMYAKRGKTLDFYHIYVPDPFRHRGIAGKLLIHAFEYAQKEGLQVFPTCPFIAGDFLKRFPRYQASVSPGAFPFAGEKKDEERGSGLA